jgi:DNA repair protein RadC
MSDFLAPNGKPSNLTPEQYKLVRTSEFKAWFGDWENSPENSSKVVDENGEPLVVYRAIQGELDYQKSGYQFFTPNINYAKIYGNNLFSCFLDIKNLLDFEYYNKIIKDNKIDCGYSNEGLFQMGNYNLEKGLIKVYQSQLGCLQFDAPELADEIYDKLNTAEGIVGYEAGHYGKAISYLIKNPNQIKLADGTNTTFDGNNPDIRFDDGGNVEKKKKITLVLDALTDSTYFGSSYNTFRYGYKDVDIVVNMVNKEYGYAKMKGKYAVINVEGEWIEGRSMNKNIYNTKEEAISYIINKLTDEDNEYADGGSVLLAPNGKPSNLSPEQYKLVRKPEFKAWFGDWENSPETASKVVDENGEPLVVWRGESKDFNVFEYKKLGSSLKTAWRNAGFYFSPTKSGAEQYMFFMGSRILKQFFLNIKNPYTLDSQEFFGVMDWGSLPTQKFKTNKSATDFAIKRISEIKSENYDGSFVTVLENNNVVEIIAFEPNQIKLADGSNTTFDIKNPDIRFKNGGLTKNNMENKIKFSKEEHKDFNFWKQDGNVSKNEDGSYSTQDAQWTNRLKDLDALKQYYYKEFLSDRPRYAGGGTTDDKHLIAKAIEFIIGSAIDTNSIEIEPTKILFKRKNTNVYTNLNKKLIEDTIRMHGKSLKGRFDKGGEAGFDDTNTSMVIYHEEKGNFMIPKNLIYLWLYEGENASEKLESGEYDFVMYPYASLSISGQKGFIPPLKKIWTKKFQKQNKGSEHLIGVIKAHLLNDGKELYIDMMSVNPSLKKHGIMSYMIKDLRDTYNLTQDQVTFSNLTDEGKKFVAKKTYANGGGVKKNAQIILTDDDLGYYAVLDLNQYRFVQKDFNLPADAINWARENGYEVDNADDFLDEYADGGGVEEYLQGKRPILTNKQGEKYVLQGFVTSGYYLIPYDGKKYWEHFSIPKNQWISEKDINWSDYNFSQEQFNQIKESHLKSEKEILSKYHSSFSDGGGVDVDLKDLKFDFTINKWGGFELGDGEYFTENLKLLFKGNPDFFIKTEEFKDYYETTFIPNPFIDLDTSGWDDEEQIKMFKYADTYRTTKLDVLNRIKKDNKIGIYNVIQNKKTNKIEIGDMAWYYLGLYDSSDNIISHTLPKKNKLYKELIELYNSNKSLLTKKEEKEEEKKQKKIAEEREYDDLMDWISDDNQYANGGWVLVDADTEKKLGEYKTESEARKMMYEYEGNSEILEKSKWDKLPPNPNRHSPAYNFADGGDTEQVYIEFLNKEKGFKKDTKYFNSYEEAVEWAKENFDKFNPDMIKYKFADGGDVPHEDKMFQLPLEMVVYVPSTQDVDKVISVDKMDKRVDEVKEYLASKFGGYTSSDKLGGYVDSTGNLVNEDVVQVTSFSTQEAYDENKEELINQLAKWGKQWGQEAIGFEFEGDLMYVPQELENETKVDEYRRGGFMYEVQKKGSPSNDMRETMFTAKNLTELKKQIIEKYGTSEGFIVSRRTEQGYYAPVKFKNGGAIYPDLSLQKADVVNDSVVLDEFQIKKTKNTFQINGLENLKITKSDDAVKILRELFEKDTISAYEQSIILYLNKNNKVIGYYNHSSGGIDGTVMDVEMISGLALKSLAKGVIVSHNHPSENTKPSDADIRITKQLNNALKLFNIDLVDSIILTENSHLSFQEEGLIY